MPVYEPGCDDEDREAQEPQKKTTGAPGGMARSFLLYRFRLARYLPLINCFHVVFLPLNGSQTSRVYMAVRAVTFQEPYIEMKSPKASATSPLARWVRLRNRFMCVKPKKR